MSQVRNLSLLPKAKGLDWMNHAMRHERFVATHMAILIHWPTVSLCRPHCSCFKMMKKMSHEDNPDQEDEVLV